MQISVIGYLRLNEKIDYVFQQLPTIIWNNWFNYQSTLFWKNAIKNFPRIIFAEENKF